MTSTRLCTLRTGSALLALLTAAPKSARARAALSGAHHPNARTLTMLRHLVVVALCVAGTDTATAQTARPLTVRVRVTDTTNAPVENASVSVVRGLNQTVASGQSDRNGVRVLRIAQRPDEFEVVVRRVGFAPGSRVFAREVRDTIRVDLVLRRLSQQLDPVRVTAEQSLKKQKLTIDAEAIASSDRPLIDATDIIFKLRPDMVHGLGGGYVCGPVQHVWVNGRRIFDPPSNAIMEAKHDDRAVAGDAASSKLFGRQAVSAHSVYFQLGVDVLSTLASIKPEHIQAIEMHDCMDKSIDKFGGDRALFITLKDGVNFDPGIGSHVGSATAADSILKRIILPARLAALRARDDSAVTTGTSAPIRARVLGVFDSLTGQPIAAADVLDVATGLHAATTETGTVSLAFLQTGPGSVVISKMGYRPDTLRVVISPTDSLPITALLTVARP